MIKLLSVLLTASIVAIAVGQVPSFGGCPTVKTQETFDINKYLGYWYEILVFPTSFEKGKCTRAKYTLQPDGKIEVYNRGIDNGQEVKAIGEAYRPDDDEQAKLLVRFSAASPYGKYWVIHTDYDTYTLIYSCESIAGLAHIEFAWVLSRNTTLDPTITQQLKDELASYKVDVSKFMVSNQTDCPP